MLRIGRTLALAIAVVAAACSARESQKSTGTNWIKCQDDMDCAIVAGSHCGGARVCVDASGNPVTRPSSTDAGREAGSGGMSSGGAPSGGTSSGGSAGSGSGGDAVTGGTSSAGGFDAGSGAPDSGTLIVDCYSPGQNLDHAYDRGAVGCKCPTGAAGLCVGSVALECEGGRWKAVNDGACFGCWTPKDPDLASGVPNGGCPCTGNEDAGVQCMHSYTNGYMHAACVGGKWKLTATNTTPCTCTRDSECGFGSRCDQGSCAVAQCQIDGVDYGSGVSGIPDPFSCNTCVCGVAGLGCTEINCPQTCPAGTVAATVCIQCGFGGGCMKHRTGCLPTCNTTADCKGVPELATCNAQHVCETTGCI